MRKYHPWDFLKECREFAKKHGHHGSIGGWIRDHHDKKIAFGWKEYRQKFMTKKEKMVKIENPVQPIKMIKETNFAKNPIQQRPEKINTLFSGDAPEDLICGAHDVTFTLIPSPFQQHPWEKRAQDTMVRLMDFFWTSPHNSYLPIMAEIHKLLKERNAI